MFEFYDLPNRQEIVCTNGMWQRRYLLDLAANEELAGPESDKHLDHQFLDVQSDEWTKKLADAPIYAAKTALVTMRRASPGERLSTVLANGTFETSNTAGKDDFVVTNPGGEEYIINASKATKRYEPTDQPGVYRAKGIIRVVDNPTRIPICIIAPWGELQFGGADCKIVTTFDPERPDEIGGDRYIIGAEELKNTYVVIPRADLNHYLEQARQSNQ